MHFLKNLMITAVLVAVGYAVYVSLQHNNADPGQPPGVAEGWAPKVELPGAKVSSLTGGPLPLTGTPARPIGQAGSVAGGMAPPYNPPPGVAAPASARPLPSSSPSTPIAALGTPVPQEAVSVPASTQPAANAVCNLSPPPDLLAANVPAASTPNPTVTLLQSKFAALMAEVQKKLDEGKLSEAHAALSALYGNPGLPGEEAKQITDLLDQLAGTVIYSRQFYLEPPYLSQPGETIEAIAQKYSVPWELLRASTVCCRPATR